MTGFEIITDLQRIVAMEARSGEPTAPVRPDPIRLPRQSVLALARLQLTGFLRWAADIVEPAQPRAETFPSQQRGSC
jgi:hypothetical protein